MTTKVNITKVCLKTGGQFFQMETEMQLDQNFINILQINIKEHITEKEVCGFYYKCCWPCVCDLMKYAKVKKITREFKEGNKDMFALVINNPCTKNDFPKKVNKNYFCRGNKLDDEQVKIQDGKLIIGMLHEANYCEPSDLRKIYANKITGRFCPYRNSTPIDELKSGMGDVFIKLAR